MIRDPYLDWYEAYQDDAHERFTHFGVEFQRMIRFGQIIELRDSNLLPEELDERNS